MHAGRDGECRGAATLARGRHHLDPPGAQVGGVTTKVLLLQGEQDFMVPASHAHYLAATIPGAELRVDPDGGHMTAMNHLEEVHDWLLETLRSS